MQSKMDISRIIFVVESSFTERDYARYGIKALTSRGLEVCVYDVSLFLSPELAVSKTLESKDIFSIVTKFSTFTQIQSSIEKMTLQDCIFICFPFKWGSKKIFKALDKKKLFYGIGNQNILPRPGLQKNRPWLEKARFGMSLLRKNPSSFFNFFYTKLPQKAFSIQNGASFIILGGSASATTSPIITKQTKNVFSHSFDYDIFLKEKDNSVIEENEIVFVDQYLPYHAEWEALGYKSPVPAKPYYKNLRDLFAYLEHKFQVKVVIAAHPHSEYETKKECFEGYQIYYGKSIELIRRSKLVLGHSSTAITFAVLFRKPISLITDQYLLRNTLFQPEIEQMANALCRKIIQVEKKENTNWEEELKIDGSAYNEYKCKYIKAENSPEKSGWEIFADFLKKD